MSHVRRCAFLTLDDPSAYVVDDDHAIEPMRALGWDVASLPWRRAATTPADYDCVVIRSTYDYVTAPDEFIDALSAIERTGTPLFNSLELVRWNHRKTYLADLEARGVPIVPTLLRPLQANRIAGLFDELGADEIVIKPLIGANASGAYRLDSATLARRAFEVEAFYAGRDAMVQPFVPAVVTEGEFSLVYFDGEFSHALLKTPRAADFRVQEEHGGRIQGMRPPPALRAAADTVIGALDETPLYARVDLVRAGSGDAFWLMELELIEPSLYLRVDPDAPARFARAIDARFARATDARGT